MSKHTTVLKWLLLAGAVYFLGVSAAHMTGVKVPLLFVYFSLPSHAYQDRVVSFLSFGWSVFLFTASRDPVKNRALVRAILIAGVGAIFGLNVINNVTDFHALSPEVHPAVFRMETLGLSAYVGSLIIFYYLSKKDAISRQ
jgi:hypothetical protein